MYFKGFAKAPFLSTSAAQLINICSCNLGPKARAQINNFACRKKAIIFLCSHTPSTPLRATHQLWVIFYGPNKICNILMMWYSLNMRHLQPYSILHSSKRVNYDFTFSTYSRNVNCTYFMKKNLSSPFKRGNSNILRRVNSS